MTSEEVTHLQELLNKVGGLLVIDGDPGRNTRRAIADARSLAELGTSEDADQALTHWLEAAPDPSPDLPTAGVTFIAREEVGGRDYYERHTAVPHWPGEASGITIGVGYDLRFSYDIFEADWGDKLTDEARAALTSHLGKLGSKATADALSGIRILWSLSWQVFVSRSLPGQVDKTRQTYPTFAQLPALCRSVLVSLVFNRGGRLEDTPGQDTRREMRTIGDLLGQNEIDEVPEQLLSMRRVWPNSRGLRARREREAALWREGTLQG